MKRLRAWLGVLLVFLLGAVCGSVVTVGAVKQHIRELISGSPAKKEDPIVTKLRNELKLDAAQQEGVRKLVAEARLQIEAIRQKVQPDTRGVMKDGEEKVRALLRPDQAARFDKLLQESHEKQRGKP